MQRLNFIDVATGSLGQGLSMATGMAYAGKYLDKASYRTYCLLGDGETAEGAVWEAAAFASHNKLDNLVAIVDINRLGQSQPTQLAHDLNTYARRFEAFGWHAIQVDGHSVEQLLKAYQQARGVKASENSGFRPINVYGFRLKTSANFDFRPQICLCSEGKLKFAIYAEKYAYANLSRGLKGDEVITEAFPRIVDITKSPICPHQGV